MTKKGRRMVRGNDDDNDYAPTQPELEVAVTE